MSNGYLVAATADMALAHPIGEGFGLEVIDGASVSDRDAFAAALASAANVGLILTPAAAQDEAFVTLMRALAEKLPRAQLIVASAEASAAFAFFPATWPVMSLDDARMRSNALAEQRKPQEPQPPPAPAPVEPPSPPQAEAPAPPPIEAEPEEKARAIDVEREQAPEDATNEESFSGGAAAPDVLDETPEETDDLRRAEPPQAEEEAPVAAGAAPPPAAEPAPAPPPQTRAPEPPIGSPVDMYSDTRAKVGRERLGETAPADATAFAPKKLRRATPELVRIVVHQPKDLNAVIKAAKKIDPRTDAAPSGMPIGDVALGASIGVSLEVRGATTIGALQRRTWTGEPIDFSFAVEADTSVKQVVLMARVFIDDAQIGVLAFTRNVSGPAQKAHSEGDRVRLKRHKRVFLSYSSKDRETVSQIATAYQMAGVEHFWDRASLKSGEEWHPRLRREIDRADLFHLCWSKSAADSEWVKKEAEHALTRRKKNSGKPDITVQMLDGPPWAPHPPELDSINFDDFVRAAIVGYARGDGS